MAPEEEAYVFGLLKKYHVQFFPTLMLLDSAGTPLRRVDASFMDGIEGVLEKMDAALKIGLENQPVIAASRSTLEGSGALEEKLAACKTFFEVAGELKWCFDTTMDAVLALDSENEHGFAIDIYMEKLAGTRFDKPESVVAGLEIATRISTLKNVDETMKKTAHVWEALLLKQQGKTEGAVSALEKAQGLESFRGRPFPYEKYMEKIKQP